MPVDIWHKICEQDNTMPVNIVILNGTGFASDNNCVFVYVFGMVIESCAGTGFAGHTLALNLRVK